MIHYFSNTLTASESEGTPDIEEETQDLNEESKWGWHIHTHVLRSELLKKLLIK